MLRAGGDGPPVLVPDDLGLREPLGLAVERQRLVLRHRHGGRVLRDVRRTELTWNHRKGANFKHDFNVKKKSEKPT